MFSMHRDLIDVLYRASRNIGTIVSKILYSPIETITDNYAITWIYISYIAIMKDRFGRTRVPRIRRTYVSQTYTWNKIILYLQRFQRNL